MNPHYEGETLVGDPRNPFRDRAVLRLTDTQRESFRVFIDDNGLIRQADNGDLFDTTQATNWSGDGGRAIFVMDSKGNIYASNIQVATWLHHSTLGDGQAVAAAGEIRVVNGKIEFVTDASGHYRPEPKHMMNLLEELRRLNVGDVPIFDHRTGQLLNPQRVQSVHQ